MKHDQLIQRLWDKDTSLWTEDPNTQKKIQDRLGWLDCPVDFNDKIEPIARFEKTIPYADVVLLGMGGSSLIADVYAHYIPKKDQKRNFYILDTTDTEKISFVLDQIDLANTLFIVASKSGTTLEVQSLFDFFWDRCPNKDQYIAITDRDTPLLELAQQYAFRKVFVNPSDIGGRFAALSYFGLVPLSLIGVDLHTYWNFFLKDVSTFRQAHNESLDFALNLFEKDQKGINKLCLQATPGLERLSDWIEQLLAESTGKEDKGILPVVQPLGEPIGPDCSLYVLTNDPSKLQNNSGHTLRNIYDLSKVCFFWEMTVALLGHLMKINPFDEPHVVLSKKKTSHYLQGTDPQKAIDVKLLQYSQPSEGISSFLQNMARPSFICILSYLPQNKETRERLKNWQKKLTQKHNVCVVIGEGPRYLHSTGQFHKGGPNQGRFIILTQNQPSLKVAKQNYDFNILKLAQAVGDYEALTQQDRKTYLIHFDQKQEIDFLG